MACRTRDNPVLPFHQLEPAVHVVERQPVRDERLDVDVPGEPTFDQAWHTVTALDAAERGAGDTPAGPSAASCTRNNPNNIGVSYHDLNKQ